MTCDCIDRTPHERPCPFCVRQQEVFANVDKIKDCLKILVAHLSNPKIYHPERCYACGGKPQLLNSWGEDYVHCECGENGESFYCDAKSAVVQWNAVQKTLQRIKPKGG